MSVKGQIGIFNMGVSSQVLPSIANLYLEAWKAQAVLDGVTLPSQPYLDALNTMLNTIESYNAGSAFSTASTRFFSVLAGESAAEEFYKYDVLRPTDSAFNVNKLGSPVYTQNKGYRGNATGAIAKVSAVADGNGVSNSSAMLFQFLTDNIAYGVNNIFVKDNQNDFCTVGRVSSSVINVGIHYRAGDVTTVTSALASAAQLSVAAVKTSRGVGGGEVFF